MKKNQRKNNFFQRYEFNLNKTNTFISISDRALFDPMEVFKTKSENQFEEIKCGM